MISSTGWSQWSTNTAVNTAICSTDPQAARTQIRTASDGANGMFICWIDGRNASGGSIYVQRVSNTSSQIFTKDGILVSGTTVQKGNLAMIADGSGGVIISWTENNDIYGRRIDANGNFVWSGDKLLSVTTAGNQSGTVMAVVNSTHAIAAFVDGRNNITGGTGNDIYLQKIDLATGDRLLTIDTPACRAAGNQTAIQIVPDGAGGAFVSWQDPRAASTDINIYMTRVNNDCLPSSGWATDGIPVCVATGNQTGLVMISDKNNGVYLTWQDFRAGSTNGDIYAQRVAADGNVLWTANGVPVSINFGSQTLPQILAVSDGAVLTWTDPRLGTSNRDIYAQKIARSNGDTLWAPTGGGVKICDAPGNQPSNTSDGLQLVTDGGDGAFIVWVDTRNSTTSGNDIYAQKISSAGAVQWADNGVVVTNATANQGNIIGAEYIPASGGPLVCWQDARSGTANGEIYGALLSADGNLTSNLRNIPRLEGTIRAYPIPAQHQITLSLTGVKPGSYLLQITDISGRMLLHQKTTLNSGNGLIQTNVHHLQNGMYFIRLQHEDSKASSVYTFIKQ